MGIIKDWAKSRRMTDPVRGTLHVSACTMPAEDSTSGNYNLDGVVSADGILPTAVNHSGLAKVRKWPAAGQDLPVTVDRADPTSLRIEWDEVPTGDERGAAAAALLAERMRGASTTAATVGSAQVVDLRGTGARERILAAMGDPAQLQTTIMQSLAEAGIQVPQPGGTRSSFPQPTRAPVTGADPEEPAARLRKLEDLKRQGLVDADEYARLRKQILEDV